VSPAWAPAGARSFTSLTLPPRGTTPALQTPPTHSKDIGALVEGHAKAQLAARQGGEVLVEAFKQPSRSALPLIERTYSAWGSKWHCCRSRMPSTEMLIRCPFTHAIEPFALQGPFWLMPSCP